MFDDDYSNKEPSGYSISAGNSLMDFVSQRAREMSEYKPKPIVTNVNAGGERAQDYVYGTVRTPSTPSAPSSYRPIFTGQDAEQSAFSPRMYFYLDYLKNRGGY